LLLQAARTQNHACRMGTIRRHGRRLRSRGPVNRPVKCVNPVGPARPGTAVWPVRAASVACAPASCACASASVTLAEAASASAARASDCGASPMRKRRARSVASACDDCSRRRAASRVLAPSSRLGGRVEHLERQSEVHGLGLGPEAGDLCPGGVLRRPPLARQPDGRAQLGLVRDVVLVAAGGVVHVGAGQERRVRQQGAAGSDPGGGGLAARLDAGAVRQAFPRRLDGVMQARGLRQRGQRRQQQDHRASEDTLGLNPHRLHLSFARDRQYGKLMPRPAVTALAVTALVIALFVSGCMSEPPARPSNDNSVSQSGPGEQKLPGAPAVRAATP